MVVNHALGVAGSTGGVVQGNGIPLVGWEVPLVLGVTLLQEGFVIQVAYLNAFAVLGIVNIDHQRLVFKVTHGIFDHLTEFTVGNHHLCFTMLQHEGNGFGIQAHVQGVQHSTNHRHTKVAFHHGRNVRQHHRNGITTADSAALQGRRQPAAAIVGFGPVATDGTVDNRRIIRVNTGGTFDEINGGLDRVVCVPGLKALIKDRSHWCGPRMLMLFLCVFSRNAKAAILCINNNGS